MAAGNFIVFDQFKVWMADSTFNMTSNTFKMSLHTNTYTPSISANTVFADATNELTTANGYTAGGVTLSGVTYTKSGSTTTFTCTNPTWTASGGSIGPFRIAVIYASGTLNTHVNPLVCYCVLDTADITLTSTNTFTVQINASGIYTVTGATS